MLDKPKQHWRRSGRMALPSWGIDNARAIANIGLPLAPHTLAGPVGVDVRALAHSPRLPIALAAQLLDQGIELVL